MRIAFHATLKPPDHPTPSGDRMIARLLIQVLGRIGDVRLASRLSTRGRSPEATELQRLKDAAHAEAETLLREYSRGGWRPDIWFTYHLYYKAPDWIGTRVSQALNIPYLVAEASYAGKRDRDSWAPWQAEALSQIRSADLVFCMSPRDRRGLEAVLPQHRIHDLPPFLDLAAVERREANGGHRERDRPVQLASVAMMRNDVKRDSYLEIARTLELVSNKNWHWHAVGDGPAADEIRSAFNSIDPSKITWHGRLEAQNVHRVLREADVFVWPGIGEGFGMAYLEAQAHGLPVVAYATAGVPGVVEHAKTGMLAQARDARQLAEHLDLMIADPDLRQGMGTAARRKVDAFHSLEHATTVIGRELAQVVASRGSCAEDKQP